MRAAYDSLNTLCQNGELGPSEMLLFFGFRNEAGEVDTGR